jgi:hypothetical protein
MILILLPLAILRRKISKVAPVEEENVFTSMVDERTPPWNPHFSALWDYFAIKSISIRSNSIHLLALASAGHAEHRRIFPLVDSALIMLAR